MGVPKLRRTTNESLKQCRALMQILNDADKLVIIVVVKGEDNAEGILKPDHIPNTITKLRQYFDCLFTNAKVGNLSPGIWIALDPDRESLQ